MISQHVEAAAELLVQAHREGRQLTVPLDAWQPRSRDQAYAVQDAVAGKLGAVAGWKTGAPNPEAEPVAAPLFADLVHAAPATIPASTLHMIGIEAEVAFQIGQDLPPRDGDYGRDEVAAAVRSLHPAIEVVDSRFGDWRAAGEYWRLADNQTNGAFVYGAGLEDWRAIDFAGLPIRLEIDGTVAVEAVGGNPAGDLLRLVTWLANHCARRGARRGRPLRAGDMVTTGSCTGMRFVEPGAVVAASFGALGTVSVSFPA